MADDVQITVHVRDLSGPGVRSVTRNLDQLQRQAQQMGGSLRVVGGQLGNLSNAASTAGSSLGGGMGLKGQAIGAGVALGSTLLPAIGAAAPMLVGFAAVGGGAALAMGDLKKKAKELKPAFQEWQKVAEKAVAPHTEKAVKSLKSAMKDLTPVIEVGAETFGRITEKAAEFADSPAFKGALAKNAEMGSKFVEEFAGSVTKFTQSFLDFGTKSRPALDAFQELFGGLLDTALPGMFEGLERGIGGSADIIGGLSDMLNKIIPAFGRFSGELAKATGPLLAEGFKLLGSVASTALDGLGFGLRMATPLLNDLAEGLRGIRTFGEIVAPTLKDIGSALLSVVIPPGLEDAAGPFERMANAIEQNKGAIQEAARVFGVGVISMAEMAITSLPMIVEGFQGMSKMVLTAIDGLVSGAASAFGGLPVIGDKFIEANEKFDRFKGDFLSGLDAAKAKTESFAAESLPKLAQGELKMNINNWESQIETAKGQLKTVPPEKRAELKALIADLQAKVAAAKAQLASVKGKSVNVGANTNQFTNAVGGLVGRTLGTSYINVAYRKVESNLQPKFGATGGLVANLPRRATGGEVQAFPQGGLIQGPGGPTSDSILGLLNSGPVRVSDSEYVVQAKAVAKYGVGFLDKLNAGQLRLAGYAKGGVTKAEQHARSGARGDLTVSHFGSMAGYQRSEFRSGLGNPDGVGALVNSLNQWASIIKKATHGGAEKALLKALDSTGRKLLGWEKQLGAVTKSLDAAKTKLNDLKSAASQLASSVKSGVLGSANITRGVTGDAPVTTKSVMAGLTASRDKATSFAQALADLQKKGLSGSLIQQIGEAGIEGGGLETAGALLNASSSEIKSMNSLQSQITKAATTAGKVTSDAVYAGQIKAQSVTVQRLERSQDKLTKSMDKLAASMEKMIEKAFGKKASGGIVGAAASGGLRSGLTMVGEQGFELLDLPAGSRVWSNPDSRRKVASAQPPWASMLNTPRGGAAAPAAAGVVRGDGRPMVINVSIGGNDFGQLWVDTGRREVRALGGLRATLGGMD